MGAVQVLGGRPLALQGVAARGQRQAKHRQQERHRQQEEHHDVHEEQDVPTTLIKTTFSSTHAANGAKTVGSERVKKVQGQKETHLL